jgi:hypothetical protein
MDFLETTTIDPSLLKGTFFEIPLSKIGFNQTNNL